MKNDLTDAQLDQEISVKLPLRTVLQLNAIPSTASLSIRADELKATRPNIGSKGLHGIYAGTARADDQGPDHILEVLDEAPNKMTYDDAMKWAASVGGTLPTRKQAALLFANVPELFEKEWYWTCEQYAGDEGYAWFQHVDYGNQRNSRKDDELRARAVRRLNLE
jgi:hypothetical protein